MCLQGAQLEDLGFLWEGDRSPKQADVSCTAFLRSSYHPTLYLKQSRSSSGYGDHVLRGKEATLSLAMAKVPKGFSRLSRGENSVVAYAEGQGGGAPRTGLSQEDSVRASR